MTAGWWPRAPSWVNGWEEAVAAGRIPAAYGPASSSSTAFLPLRAIPSSASAARAILGEWLGGSGGGWQDSGGVWPGIKLIHGVLATAGDPEFGISRGRLLPDHRIFTETEVPREAREKLQQSLVLVHGGMAQDVGPILEMVTEKYLQIGRAH